MEPQLRVFRGGWVAVGAGLAVVASSGQEALLRLNVQLAEGKRVVEDVIGPGSALALGSPELLGCRVIDARAAEDHTVILAS